MDWTWTFTTKYFIYRLWVQVLSSIRSLFHRKSHESWHLLLLWILYNNELSSSLDYKIGECVQESRAVPPLKFVGSYLLVVEVNSYLLVVEVNSYPPLTRSTLDRCWEDVPMQAFDAEAWWWQFEAWRYAIGEDEVWISSSQLEKEKEGLEIDQRWSLPDQKATPFEERVAANPIVSLFEDDMQKVLQSL